MRLVLKTDQILEAITAGLFGNPLLLKKVVKISLQLAYARLQTFELFMCSRNFWKGLKLPKRRQEYKLQIVKEKMLYNSRTDFIGLSVVLIDSFKASLV